MQAKAAAIIKAVGDKLLTEQREAQRQKQAERQRNRPSRGMTGGANPEGRTYAKSGRGLILLCGGGASLLRPCDVGRRFQRFAIVQKARFFGHR